MKRILLMLLTLLLVSSVQAEETAPFRVQMHLSQTAFIHPNDVTVTIRITNTTSADLPGPMALYAPNGRRIEDFGTPTLSAGETVTWTGCWRITEAQISEGQVFFAIRYFAGNPPEVRAQNLPFYLPITRSEVGWMHPEGDNQYHAVQHCVWVDKDDREKMVSFPLTELSSPTYHSLIPCTHCGAAEPLPFQAVMEPETDTFFAAGQVPVTLRITNLSGQDMSGPMALYDANGRRIDSFGQPTLSARETLTWSGAWEVTDAQIDAGKLLYGVCYVDTDEDGRQILRTATLYAPIARATQVYVNHNGGVRYHADPRCPSIHQRYWEEMIAVGLAELAESPYNQLEPCRFCGAAALTANQDTE